MSEPITIVQREAQPVLQVQSTASIFKIAAVLTEAYGKIGEHLTSTGGEACGAPFAQYTGIDWEGMTNKGFFGKLWQMLTEKMNIEAGKPVAAPVAGSGDIIATEIPAGRYVKTIHRGPYHKVGETYDLLVDWARNEGVSLQGRSIESYVDDPTLVPKAEVKTEVFIPIAD